MKPKQFANGRRDGRKERAILPLLENPSAEKAAAATGISSVTLWRWMQQREFQERLRQARRQAFSQTIGRIQHASSAAVTTLLRVMTDPAAPVASRVRAADTVLHVAFKGIESEDFDARLADLERLLEKSGEPDED